MATVAAIFDDQAGLEKAVNALEAAGLGDDIAQINQLGAGSRPCTGRNPDAG